MKKLNGFNNGRDTSDGVGGKKPFFDDETTIDELIEFVRSEAMKRVVVPTSLNKKSELIKNRPLIEHYEVETDMGTGLQVFAYIKDLEKYVDLLESQIKYAKGELDISKLKERRKKAGLTLRDVEQAIGISNAYLSQLESGKVSNPSFEKIQKLNWYYSTIGF